MADRGYMPYEPRGDALHWLRCAQRVCADYRADWPLTVRQLFYRLVAAYDFPKREADYQRLIGIVSRARRASMLGSENGIPFRAIRDDRGVWRPHAGYDDEGEFLDNLLSAAESFELDRRSGQPTHVELWCEAAGMVPIVSEVAAPYGLRVNSGGGYDSVTSKHNLATRAAREWKERHRRTLVLHVGDFDPSGVNLCDVLGEDAGAMCYQQCGGQRGVLRVERVALTPEQVIERQVITAPPKPSDSRMRRFLEDHEWVVDELGTTEIAAQLEALTPAELREVLTSAVEEHLDAAAYAGVLEEEDEIRGRLTQRLGEWRDSL